MPGITKEKYNAIQNSAMQLVAEYGIKKIDSADAFARPIITKGFAAQLMQEHNITLQTARNHIAKACRRQRHPDWKPDAEWGGQREGAGRKMDKKYKKGDLVVSKSYIGRGVILGDSPSTKQKRGRASDGSLQWRYKVEFDNGEVFYIEENNLELQ